MAAMLAEIWAPPGPPRGSKRRGGRGRASEGQAGGRGRGAQGQSTSGRPLSPPAAQVSGRWGGAGWDRAQAAAPPAQLPGLRHPPGAAAHFRRAQRKAGGLGRAPGRSRRCHLGDARHLLLRAALSSSFSSSLLPPEVLSPIPEVRTGEDLGGPLFHLLHYREKK